MKKILKFLLSKEQEFEERSKRVFNIFKDMTRLWFFGAFPSWIIKSFLKIFLKPISDVDFVFRRIDFYTSGLHNYDRFDVENTRTKKRCQNYPFSNEIF